MTIKFSLSSEPAESAATPCVVVGVFEERLLSAAAARIDEKSGGAIKRLMEASDVNGKPGTSQLLF
ncbi:MAG TPA: M17 family peptidase N-terminal domain-containing protein, partial [Rudaea sp.]|nr:M17 family peptidase N-terminal domain-containing protein [Rudaea sp.]